MTLDDSFSYTMITLLVVIQIENEGKPVSNQRSSGRCWIFACLNCMRIPVAKALEIEEFELSQNYVFLWDKVRLHENSSFQSF